MRAQKAVTQATWVVRSGGHMKRTALAFLLPVVILVCSGSAPAQTETDRLASRIKNVVEGAEQGWQCERGTSFGSDAGILEACSLYAVIRRPHEDPRRVMIRHVGVHIDLHQSADA